MDQIDILICCCILPVVTSVMFACPSTSLKQVRMNIRNSTTVIRLLVTTDDTMATLELDSRCNTFKNIACFDQCTETINKKAAYFLIQWTHQQQGSYYIVTFGSFDSGFIISAITNRIGG